MMAPVDETCRVCVCVCVCVYPLTCPTSKKLPGFRCDELGVYNPLLSLVMCVCVCVCVCIYIYIYIYKTLQTMPITAM